MMIKAKLSVLSRFQNALKRKILLASPSGGDSNTALCLLHGGPTVPLHWKPLIVPADIKKAIAKHVRDRRAQQRDKITLMRARAQRRKDEKEQRERAGLELEVCRKQIEEAEGRLRKVIGEKHEIFMQLKATVQKESDLKRKAEEDKKKEQDRQSEQIRLYEQEALRRIQETLKAQGLPSPLAGVVNSQLTLGNLATLTLGGGNLGALLSGTNLGGGSNLGASCNLGPGPNMSTSSNMGNSVNIGVGMNIGGGSNMNVATTSLIPPSPPPPKREPASWESQPPPPPPPGRPVPKPSPISPHTGYPVSSHQSTMSSPLNQMRSQMGHMNGMPTVGQVAAQNFRDMKQYGQAPSSVSGSAANYLQKLQYAQMLGKTYNQWSK